MTDDITHNLTVIREALEAEGLSVHAKLIDAVIEEISGLRDANHHYRDSAARDEKEIASLRDRLASARKALDGDLFHDQGNHQRRDASWKAGDMAGAVLEALTDDNRKIAPCDPNDLRPIWEQGLTVSSAYGKSDDK